MQVVIEEYVECQRVMNEVDGDVKGSLRIKQGVVQASKVKVVCALPILIDGCFQESLGWLENGHKPPGPHYSQLVDCGSAADQRYLISINVNRPCICCGWP